MPKDYKFTDEDKKFMDELVEKETRRINMENEINRRIRENTTPKVGDAFDWDD